MFQKSTAQKHDGLIYHVVNSNGIYGHIRFHKNTKKHQILQSNKLKNHLRKKLNKSSFEELTRYLLYPYLVYFG